MDFICVLAHTSVDEEGEQEMAPALMSIAQVCDKIGLGRTRVYEELTSGRLKSVKVGSRRLIPASMLDEWIAELVSEAL